LSSLKIWIQRRKLYKFLPAAKEEKLPSEVEAINYVVASSGESAFGKIYTRHLSSFGHVFVTG